MKYIYLKCYCETGIFAGDRSNGNFYSGFLELEDSEIDEFFKNFKKNKKVKMYPHSKDKYWSQPFFDDKLKTLSFKGKEFFDFKDRGFAKQGPKSEFTNYKYYYWFDVLDKKLEQPKEPQEKGITWAEENSNVINN